MNKKYIATLALACCVSLSVGAQKRNTTNTRQKPATPVKVQKSAADLLFENMLPNTQRIFVIDSAVVDQELFLTAIPLPADNGSIVTYNDFFGTDDQNGQYVYINGFRNKCFYSEIEDEHVKLYTRDKINGKWTKPQELEGLANFADDMAFPFMMSDGSTLYFAAKGKESIGGYDIFVTRYDNESNRYLKPENVGLPFNSKADDFFYIEDDMNQLAWFVTSRNQPEGKVCVYTLVPAENRENYDVNLENLPQLASLTCIRDTWPSVAKRNQAMKRLKELREETVTTKENNIYFPVNDHTVYRSLSDFHSDENRSLFELMQSMSNEVKKEIRHLDLIRKEFHGAAGETRQRLGDDIIDYESIIKRQQKEISRMAKQLRNSENEFLGKK